MTAASGKTSSLFLASLSRPKFGKLGVLTAQDGTPWFNAVDVCKVLGLKNPSQALKDNVDEADLRITETRSGGQTRKVNFVDEADTCKQRIRSGGQVRILAYER